ncbi:ABC transporter permease, partial [Schumannella luteola]
MSDKTTPPAGETPEAVETEQVPVEQRAPEAPVAQADPPPAANRVLREILTSNWLISLLAIVVALLIGAILIAVTDPAVQKAAGYFFA